MRLTRVLVLVWLAWALPAGGEVVRIQGLSRAELGALIEQHDFWGVDRRDGAAIFQLSAAQRAALEASGLRIETDALRQARLDAWQAVFPLRARAGSVPGFACYRSVDRTHADLAALAQRHPSRARWQTLGPGWQLAAGDPDGESLHALVIDDPAGPASKPPVVIVAAQHARELVTAEIATRLAEWLLDNPDRDPDIAALTAQREIHIIAQANPDGRERVEQGLSLWRKNANTSQCPSGNTTSTWPGVDLNRNASFLWGEFASSDACAQNYRGTAVASEPETRAVEDWLAGVFERQRPAVDLDSPAPADARGVLISLHAFGELVLLPWEGRAAGNQNNAPNHDGLTILGRRFGFVTGYDVGRWQLLPPAGGTLVDHAYAEYGVASYTLELGTDFLQPCADFETTIWPAAREALVLAIKAAEAPYRAPAGPEITAAQIRFSAGHLLLAGRAEDDRYRRGPVTEPPSADPIEPVVELRLSPGAPESVSGEFWTIPLPAPAVQVDFELELPADFPPPANRRVHVRAVDAAGQAGFDRAVHYDDRILANGFEAAEESG